MSQSTCGWRIGAVKPVCPQVCFGKSRPEFRPRRDMIESGGLTTGFNDWSGAKCQILQIAISHNGRQGPEDLRVRRCPTRKGWRDCLIRGCRVIRPNSSRHLRSCAMASTNIGRKAISSSPRRDRSVECRPSRHDHQSEKFAGKRGLQELAIDAGAGRRRGRDPGNCRLRRAKRIAAGGKRPRSGSSGRFEGVAKIRADHHGNHDQGGGVLVNCPEVGSPIGGRRIAGCRHDTCGAGGSFGPQR